MKKALEPELTLEKLILSLIKDDLINTKLVHSLEDLGLDAMHYCLHLSETIFELLGIQETVGNEEISEYYYMACKQVKQIDIKDSNRPLDALAKEIYEGLVDRRKSNTAI